MSKRFALIVFLFLVSPLARADSFVSVVMNPQVFQVNGGETVGATFIWDTTNGTLSNVTLTATGTYWQGTDSATVYGGGITGTSLAWIIHHFASEKRKGALKD